MVNALIYIKYFMRQPSTISKLYFKGSTLAWNLFKRCTLNNCNLDCPFSDDTVDTVIFSSCTGSSVIDRLLLNCFSFPNILTT
ncbi:hypothetical protein MAR_008035 [Mya arenaria]|uniref:Uncharacterized protein n=1 Tax=Mya arenaria TaxID=6604 RepID=A0ABY7DUR8_MYAAR|nr:hypothetical protein MAR_008035 [Mya arenaria]